MTRPADSCPYQRPFPPDFRECPTFEGQTWLPFDSQFQLLKAQRTCRHLTVGRQNGSFYGKCALGDAAERSRLLDVTATA